MARKASSLIRLTPTTPDYHGLTPHLPVLSIQEVVAVGKGAEMTATTSWYRDRTSEVLIRVSVGSYKEK